MLTFCLFARVCDLKSVSQPRSTSNVPLTSFCSLVFWSRYWQPVMRFTFLCLLTISTVAATRRPHIIMVVADDLGWNDVSFHGSTQIPTPTLDKLANDGVQLNNYYVQPVCSPTRSCLLTGRHVIHSGIYDPDCGQGTTYAVPLNFTMLPRHLKTFNYEVRANAAHPALSCSHHLRGSICSLTRNVFPHPLSPFPVLESCDREVASRDVFTVRAANRQRI